MSRVVVIGLFVVVAACSSRGAEIEDGPSPGVTEPESQEPSGEPAEGLNSDPQGSGAPEQVSVWVGVYCELASPGGRTLSFYLDGHQIQEVETPCSGGADPLSDPPNGGQFYTTATVGVHLLRVQDDTDDYFSEHEVAIPGEHWLVIRHRVLAEGTGHLTSVEAHYTRPRFAY